MRVYASPDFEIWERYWEPPKTCLAVEPGVVDFPARCVGTYGHPEKRHHSASLRIGVIDERPTDITYWEDEADAA